MHAYIGRKISVHWPTERLCIIYGPDRTNGPIQNTVRRGPVRVLCQVLYFADLVRKLLCAVRDNASSPLRLSPRQKLD